MKTAKDFRATGTLDRRNVLPPFLWHSLTISATTNGSRIIATEDITATRSRVSDIHAFPHQIYNASKFFVKYTSCPLLPGAQTGIRSTFPFILQISTEPRILAASDSWICNGRCPANFFVARSTRKVQSCTQYYAFFDYAFYSWNSSQHFPCVSEKLRFSFAIKVSSKVNLSLFSQIFYETILHLLWNI